MNGVHRAPGGLPIGNPTIQQMQLQQMAAADAQQLQLQAQQALAGLQGNLNFMAGLAIFAGWLPHDKQISPDDIVKAFEDHLIGPTDADKAYFRAKMAWRMQHPPGSRDPDAPETPEELSARLRVELAEAEAKAEQLRAAMAGIPRELGLPEHASLEDVEDPKPREVSRPRFKREFDL